MPDIVPFRQYARTAIPLCQDDAIAGVLLERLASYLCVELRALRGRATARLEQVPLGEANEMRRLAAGVLRVSDALHTSDPPTPSELTRYETRKAQLLARARVRAVAELARHRLSVWRPDGDRPGYERAMCERCGAGAVIHLETSSESVSPALLAACPRFSAIPQEECSRVD